MKFRNVIASSALLFVFAFSCKPTTPSVPDGGNGGVGGTSATESGAAGGAGGVVEETTASSTSVTSTSSGPVIVLTGPCVKSCPEVLPTTGEACDAAADQYCEYAGSVCRFANCNSSSAVWEIGDLNPCACFPGSGTPTRLK